MAAQVTIATFNAENLFTRYNFKGEKTNQKDAKGKWIYRPYTPVELAKAVRDGFIHDTNLFKKSMKPIRGLTAKTIRAVKADIVGLQEVENLDTLKKFNRDHLKSGKFKYQMVIDGNDNRYIDVGLLSNIPIDAIRTHQFVRTGRSKTFARDCLEAHFNINGKPLAVFVNHFTSMMRGRSKSKYRRVGQSEAVLQILKDRFGSNFGKENFVILGDLNDYMVAGKENESGIQALLESNQMVNVVDRLAADDRWTHYYKGDKSYHQLDYLLVSSALAQKNKNVLPVIERRGQPLRVNQKNKPPAVKKFFPGIKGKSKASDHCPVAITLKL